MPEKVEPINDRQDGLPGRVESKAKIEPEGRTGMRRFPLWLNIVISLAFLLLSLRGVDLKLVLSFVIQASLPLLVLSFVINVIQNYIRAQRWVVYLGGQPGVSIRASFSSMAIGNMINNVLPARLGEVARIYLLEKKTGVRKSTSMATIVLERLFDLLLLLLVVQILGFFLPLPRLVGSSVTLLFPTFSAVLVLLLLMTKRTSWQETVVKKITSMLPSSFAGKLLGIIDRFISGLSVLKSRRQFMSVVALGVAIWSLEMATVSLLFASVDVLLPWLAVLTFLVVVSLSFIIPSGPGSIGTYEFFAVLVLTSFGIDQSRSFGLAVLSHAFGFFTATVLGIFCLWFERLSFSALVRTSRT